MSKASLLITLCLIISMNVQGQENPSEYMGKFSEGYDQIKKDTWDYIRKASRGKNAEKIEKRRLELLTTLRLSKANAERTPSYNEDKSLREAVVNYLNNSIIVLNDDFQKIVDLERIAENSYDAMEAYLLTKEQVNMKMDSSENALISAEKLFAAKHNINLVKGEQSKISRKLSNASDVISYYNKVYLIFFKSYWYESEMIKSMSEGKISDIEQFRQSLESVTEEGLINLKSIAAFRKDQSLKTACYEVLKYYQQESALHVPEIVDFHLKKEELETSVQNFQSKKKKDITQKDVDEYNKSVKIYNELINTYNETNNFLNTSRSKVLKRWNNQITDFQSEHI